MRVVKYNNRDPERLWNVYRGYSELDLKSPEPAPSKLAVVLSAAGRGLEAAGDPLQPKSFYDSASFRMYLVFKVIGLEE